MVLRRGARAEAFRERVKIYATDVDEEALATARHGVYADAGARGRPARAARALLRARRTALHRSAATLRRAVIFGRHDLVQDAPISRIDLLCRRNTLMYFNAETQARILAHFHFALRRRRLPVPRQVRDAARALATCSRRSI